MLYIYSNSEVFALFIQLYGDIHDSVAQNFIKRLIKWHRVIWGSGI
jgi:hypothetical protein